MGIFQLAGWFNMWQELAVGLEITSVEIHGFETRSRTDL